MKVFRKALTFAIKVGINYGLLLAGMVVASWILNGRIYQINVSVESLWFLLGVSAFGEVFSTILGWAMKKCSETIKTSTEKGESKD